jgi:hypothetical protein
MTQLPVFDKVGIMKTRKVTARSVAISLLLVSSIIASASLSKAVRQTITQPNDVVSSFQMKAEEKHSSSSIKMREYFNSDIPDDVFHAILERIKALRTGGSIDEIKTEGDAVQREWGENGGNRYGLIIRELAIVLHSNMDREDEAKRLALSDEYSVAALRKADTFDLETEVFLLRYLGHRLGRNPLTETAIQDRHQRLEMWIHACRRLAAEKDPKYDPNDKPWINVPLPKGVNGMPGMHPDNIRDQNLRAEYEQAIERNNKKIEYGRLQSKLRDLEKTIYRDGSEHISKMYSQLPLDTANLFKTLKESGISPSVQERIMSDVRKAITSGE